MGAGERGGLTQNFAAPRQQQGIAHSAVVSPSGNTAFVIPVSWGNAHNYATVAYSG